METTDGTAEYGRDTYRNSFFYDPAKSSVLRMTFSLGHAPGHARGPRGATAVALTPGRMRAGIMPEHYGVTEENRRDAVAAEPHFGISESPSFVGRAVAALAADPGVARWNGGSTSSGQLAREYGFTDRDGSRPDCRRHLVGVTDAGGPPTPEAYR